MFQNFRKELPEMPGIGDFMYFTWTGIKALPYVPGALTGAFGLEFPKLAHAASVVKEAGKETLEALREKKDILTNLDNTNKLPAKVGVVEIKKQLIALNDKLGNIIKPIKLSQEKSNTDFNKFVNESASAYKDNTRTLAYYKNNSNRKLSHAALLALSVQPVLDTHLLGKQLSQFKTALAYVALLDVFIEVDGIPDFFEKYVDNIELSGITLGDIEFLLSLVISLIMLDLDPANQEYGYMENKILKIPYMFNSFNIIFKHNYLADTILPFTKQKAAQISKNIIKAGGIIFETIFQKTDESIISKFNTMNFVKDKIIDELFKTEQYKNECIKLYDSGGLTLSKLLVYFIYEMKQTIPGISMFDLGIYGDIFKKVLNNNVMIVSKDHFNSLYAAHKELEEAKADQSKKDAIAKYKAEVEKIRGLGREWKQTGGAFPLLIPIAASVGYGIYNYLHKYTAKAKDIIEEVVIKQIAYVNPSNLSYTKLADHSKDTNNIIDIIESKKYPFLASLLLYIQLNTTITQHDRLLLFNNIECGAQPQVPPIVTFDAAGFAEIGKAVTELTNAISANTLQFTNIGDLLAIINIVFTNAFTTYNFMDALDKLKDCHKNTNITHDQTITPIINALYNYIAAVKGNNKSIMKLFLLFINYINIYMLCTDYFKYIQPHGEISQNDKSTINAICTRITLAIYRNKPDEIKAYIYDCINYSGDDNTNMLTFNIIKYCAYKYMLGKAGQVILAKRMALLTSRGFKLTGGADSDSSNNEPFGSATSGDKKPSSGDVATPALEPVAPVTEPVATPAPEPEITPAPGPDVTPAPEPEKSSSRSKKVSKYIQSPRHKTKLSEEDKIAEEAEKIKEQDMEFIKDKRVKISDKGVFYNIFVNELFKYNFGVSSTLLMGNLGAYVENGLFRCHEFDTMNYYFNILNNMSIADTTTIRFMEFD